MIYRYYYPEDWPLQVEETRERAGWLCEVCMVPHGAIVRSLRTGNPYVVYLQAAHVNHDHDNPDPDLKAVCPTCHGRYFRRQRIRVPVCHRLCKRRRTLQRVWDACEKEGKKHARPTSLPAQTSIHETTTLQSFNQPRSAPSHCSRAVQFGWQLKDER